ncbi:tryptophan 2,3-dioxygenase [Streptomyces anulatus]|uniref:Tryptophan 2,3-dioxygenase n=1 Tax=Streptomyces anulatus TaxID=1892 RepID=D6R243_STRAQ|nr:MULTISPECIES: tryptophan 2,3-dioxygenase family protein [Streptomyces]ADG27362.1 tryptophan 2,3-dioxygenase [Streptomyces anulatus]KPL30041.1 tryptophan 2,3-dioxygenase [Streptomyces anulatus]
MTVEQEATGCPFSGAAPDDAFAPYVQYARMNSLLSLQHPLSTADTEPGFIIMSQVKELLFKLLHTELTTARDQLRKDGLDDALWTLRRAGRVQQVLLVSWETFAVLSPVEFAEFRDVLGTASGFQSVGYRRLEFLLGNKNPAMVEPHRDSPAYQEVLAQLHEPSLYDEALALLTRRGLLAAGQQGGPADPAAPYRSGAEVEAAWLAVYRDPTGHRDLHLLAEALMDLADQFARWRYTHLVTVQRMLGAKPGTGGTSGVSWLSGISEHRFFPELWSVRSEI